MNIIFITRQCSIATFDLGFSIECYTVANKKMFILGVDFFLIFRESTTLELSKTLWDFIVGLLSSEIVIFKIGCYYIEQLLPL